jgi:RNA-binding protein
VNVPVPQNPKKRSLMPSSPLRRRLRADGHHLSPVVQVGKEGVTEGVLRQLDQALLDHELVKVKMGTETPEDRFASAEALVAGAEGAHLAQILGRTLLVYRRHPRKPRYEPLPAVPAPPRGARPERTARTARPARSEPPPRSTRAQRTERFERAARPERRERAGRPERSGRPERTGRPERPGRAERTGRPERAGRPGRGEKKPRGGRPERPGRFPRR